MLEYLDQHGPVRSGDQALIDTFMKAFPGAGVGHHTGAVERVRLALGKAHKAGLVEVSDHVWTITDTGRLVAKTWRRLNRPYHVKSLGDL